MALSHVQKVQNGGSFLQLQCSFCKVLNSCMVYMEHANLGSIHLFMQSLSALTHTQSHTHTHRILVNPKHSFQLKFRHIPLIEGFALLFMGPSVEYGCFITISLVLVGPFFPLHYIVPAALLWNAEDCDLNGF